MRAGARWALAFALVVGWGASARAARIEGQIYDSVTGEPVRGVGVSLSYDVEDPLEPGLLVPAERLGGGQQGQVTGADGRYGFDVPAGPPARRYRLELDVSRGARSFPSRRIPPRPGFAVVDADGRVVPDATPAPPEVDGADRSHYLRFAVTADDTDVRNNHLAVDPLAAVIDFDKRADRAEASTGDLVLYTITAVNRSERDFRIATGRGLYILDAPARGLSYLAGQASARLERGESSTILRAGSGFQDRPEGSARLIRFGPFDLPRGATLTLHYQVTVGVDTRPGRYENRAALRDAGGVELARPAVAFVRVVADAALETGVVLGRVYCDGDGDRRRDPGEPGVFGARVYASTGAYAVADSAGLYHLSGLRAGSHVIEVDEATLAGGRAAGDAGELIRLTDGLSARVDFPVACASVEVGPGHPRFHLRRPGDRRPLADDVARGVAPASGPATLRGDLGTLTLALDGRPMPLPSAALTLPGDRNRPPVPATGWTPPLTWSAAVTGGTPARWTLVVARIDGTALQPVRTLGGEGAVPPAIAWDGLADDGRPVATDALYAAQLTVQLADGGQVASPRGVVGVGFGQAPAAEQLVWRGRLFAGGAARPQPTAFLRQQLAALAARLGPDDRVILESHWDGSGDDLATVARTQREAAAAAALLVGAGVSADRITARGRGSMDRLDPARTATARASNRRLIIDLVHPPSPNAGAAIPAVHEGDAGVLVDGHPAAVDAAGRFRAPVRGPRVAVDLRARDGRRAAVDLPLGRRGADDAAAPTPVGPEAPRPSATGDIIRLRVHLPPEDTRLRTDELAVTGRAAPGTRVLLEAGKDHRTVVVAADGRFAAMLPLAADARHLHVVAIDRDGNAAVVRWPIQVDPDRLFLVGLVEGIAATAWTARGWLADAAWMDGMSERSAVGAGPLLLHGRAVAYVKARVRSRALGDVAITGHVDTARPSGSGAFHDDPLAAADEPPVWGDSATEVRDVNTRGRAYLRVDSDEVAAVLGSLHSDLRAGHLFRYDRAVDGALVSVDRYRGDHDLQVRAFGTSDLHGLARDVNWFRATGGSFYYLRHRMVVEGSERLRAVVRERDTGLVVAERLLERNLDYSIDWSGGRVLLTAPLASTAGSGWVIHDLEASTTPLDGDPVYLEVSYEHADPAGGARAAGATVSEEWRGLSIGAGVVGEGRDDAADHTHWGVAAGARADHGITLGVELAGSRAGDGSDALSADGGLTFLDLDHLATTSAGAGRGTAWGWRVTGELDGERSGGHRLLTRTRASVLVQDLDRDFSGGGTLLEQGRLEVVGMVNHRLSPGDALTLRHVAEIAELPRVGPTAADVAASADPLAFDERATYRTTLQWARARGPWTLKVEGMHQRLTSTAVLASGDPVIDADRLGVGAAAGWRRSDRLLLRASQQAQLGLGDRDPQLDPLIGTAGGSDAAGAGIITGVGADVRLTGDVTLTTDWLQAWNGDGAAQVGLRSGLSPTGSMYVSQRAGGRDGRFVATTIVGAEDRLASGSRSYGEYQLDNGALGQRNRAVLGLGHRWRIADGLRMAGGFEHQHVFGGYLPDGTPVGNLQRDIVHAALELTRFERLRAGARVELRFDNGPPAATDDDFPIAEDPRAQAGPGAFADHGGVAPGAPLVLARGQVIQLVAGGGAALRLVDALTLLGRGRLAETERDAGQIATVARWRELTGGLAWRPEDRDWLDVLARYSWVRSWRPPGEQGPSLDENAHVWALLGLADLPARISLSGKLAFKRSEAATTLLAGERRTAGVDALLWLVRGGYRLRGRWDAALELRQLLVDRAGILESRWGTLIELGVRANRVIRLGAGYDFGHFASDELGDLERDSHGLFVRVTGQY